MVPVDSDSLSRVESYSGALRAFSHFAYGTITPCGAGFRRLQRYYLRSQIRVLQPRPDKSDRFGLFRVRSPLLTKSRFLSLPGGNEMFQFPPFATYTYVFSIRSYRVSRGRYLFDGSHGLFAVFRALHRLLMPRHPPHALTSLTTLLNLPVTRTLLSLPLRLSPPLPVDSRVVPCDKVACLVSRIPMIDRFRDVTITTFLLRLRRMLLFRYSV